MCSCERGGGKKRKKAYNLKEGFFFFKWGIGNVETKEKIRK